MAPVCRWLALQRTTFCWLSPPAVLSFLTSAVLSIWAAYLSLKEPLEYCLLRLLRYFLQRSHLSIIDAIRLCGETAVKRYKFDHMILHHNVRSWSIQYVLHQVCTELSTTAQENWLQAKAEWTDAHLGPRWHLLTQTLRCARNQAVCYCWQRTGMFVEPDPLRVSDLKLPLVSPNSWLSSVIGDKGIRLRLFRLSIREALRSTEAWWTRRNRCELPTVVRLLYVDARSWPVVFDIVELMSHKYKL